MKIKIVYTKNARKNLRSIEPKKTNNIILKIKFYSEQKNTLQYAKKLKTPFDNMYRFKVGDYRIIFEIDSKGKVTILTVLNIKHRKDVYR